MVDWDDVVLVEMASADPLSCPVSPFYFQSRMGNFTDGMFLCFFNRCAWTSR